MCELISDKTNTDYYHTSSFVNIFILIEPWYSLTEPIGDVFNDQVQFDVYYFAIGIRYSTFVENFAGMKGTALNLR